MDDQRTEALGEALAKDELRRARRVLMIWLLPYTAIAMAAVLMAFVAVPLAISSLADAGAAAATAGAEPPVLSLQLARTLSSGHIWAVQGAVALALGMRVVLNDLLDNGVERAGGGRGGLYDLVVGLAILYTAFLALIFMRHMRPSNPLRIVLLGAAVAVVTLMVSYFFWILIGDSLLYIAPWLYLAGYAFWGLAFGAVVAVPMWQMMNRAHDKQPSRAVWITAACGLAAGAVWTVLLLLSIRSSLDGYVTLSSFLIPFLPALIPLLMLPPLLRASAAYGRLRNAGGSAP